MFIVEHPFVGADLYAGTRAPNEHVLSLAAPDGLISSRPQDAVDAWHHHQRHALASAPTCLFLHLPGFRINDQGYLVKIPIDLQSSSLWKQNGAC